MNIQDRKKSLTAEDLRRRYNLDDLDKDRKSIQLVKNTLNKVEIEFQNFMDAIKKVLNDYPSQVEITTWFLDGIPTDEQPEFDDQSEHLGDLYYDRQSGKSYEYIYENDEYIWEEITDRNIVKTLVVESSKADTSDNKRLIFNGTPTPPYSIGDVWINGSTYYRCRCARESGTYNIADWVIYTDYTDDMVLLDTRAALDQLQTTVTQDYVSQTQLETSTQGIYATVSSKYATQTTVSTLDGEIQNTKTDVRDIDTRLSVEEGKMTSVISDIGNRTGKTSSLTQEVDEIRAEISEVADMTISGDTVSASLELENINQSEPVMIKIHPISENISYDYPYNDYPQNDYSKTRYLMFMRTYEEGGTTKTQYIPYILPDDLLYYDSTHYDEFLLDYGNKICQVTKRCKYNADGSVGLLNNERIDDYSNNGETYPTINLGSGNYTISLPNYQYGYLFARLVTKNIYTDQFYLKLETDTLINQTAKSINLSVDTKLSNYSNTSEMNAAITIKANEIDQTVSENYVGNNEIISKINQSAEQITINADKINIEGKAVKFKTNLLTNYIYTSEDVTKIQEYILGVGTLTPEEIQLYDVNGDGVVDNYDAILILNFIRYNQGKNSGTFEINPYDPQRALTFKDYSDTLKTNIGLYSVITHYTKSNWIKTGTLEVDDSADIKGPITLIGENDSTISNSEINYSGVSSGVYYTTNIKNTGIVTPSVTQTSLESHKKDFEKFENALDIIKNIDIYKYHLKGQEDKEKKHIGFVIGDKFNYSDEITSENNDGVDLYSFVSVCCKAIQEQQIMIEKLENRIKELESDK